MVPYYMTMAAMALPCLCGGAGAPYRGQMLMHQNGGIKTPSRSLALIAIPRHRDNNRNEYITRGVLFIEILTMTYSLKKYAMFFTI